MKYKLHVIFSNNFVIVAINLAYDQNQTTIVKGTIAKHIQV